MRNDTHEIQHFGQDKKEVMTVQTKTKQDAQLEQNKREKPMPVLAKVALIGFIGGVFWSFLAYCAYFFILQK